MRELTGDEDAAVERVAKFVVRLGLTVPAILWLESMRPLTFVGSQFMVMLSPSITTMLPSHHWDALSSLLEEREGVEVLIARIEALDREKQVAA